MAEKGTFSIMLNSPLINYRLLPRCILLKANYKKLTAQKKVVF